jgi:hypothetical protein
VFLGSFSPSLFADIGVNFRWKQWKAVVCGMIVAGVLAVSQQAVLRAADRQGILQACVQPSSLMLQPPWEPAMLEAAREACDEGVLKHLPPVRAPQTHKPHNT